MSYPDWIKKAVFYEIYPQSFNDSNSDGIGDIPGIIEKLDYIESLGCDAIWIHPCFESPFNDAGYDISDFYKVAPRYGTNSDIKRLFKKAHKRGIKVILDLVAGHTSLEHKWFKESCKIKPNKYSNRYIWTDGWCSPSGIQRSINGYAKRNGRFVINFFWCQPALNYGHAKLDPQCPWQLPVDHPDCVETRNELVRIMRFWLDMGCDGFRVDMAPSLVKNDPDKKATVKLWQGIFKNINKDYPQAVMISEWFDPPKAIESGFHIDFAHICSPSPYQKLFRAENNANVHTNWEGHSFFNRLGQGDASAFLKEFKKQMGKINNDGFIGLYSGNHDISRIALNRNRKEIELVFAFLMTMKAVPFVYYGDEIGMKYLDLESYEGGYNRTGSRTPMQWNKKKNAGFSEGPAKQLYLPLDQSKKRPDVESQDSDPRSLLNSVRRLIALRRENSALQAGGILKPLYVKPNEYPLVYMRESEKQKVVVMINPRKQLSNASFKVPHAKNKGKILCKAGSVDIQKDKSVFNIKMQALSYAIVEISE